MKVDRGFTLIELITVISIIAILSAIAVPQYRGYIERARKVKVISTGEEIFCAAIWSCRENEGLNSPIVVKADVKDITLIELTSAEFSNDKSVLRLYYIEENGSYVVEINMSLNSYTIKEKETGAVVYK